MAAVRCGFGFIGIEKEDSYYNTSQRRIYDELDALKTAQPKN